MVKCREILRLRVMGVSQANAAYSCGWMLESLKDDEARNARGSLMLRSQFGTGGWAKKLGGDAIAESIVDRIVRNSYVIYIEGDESMRERISSIA